MLNWIDNLLNRVTMYRLVLYVLLFLLGAAFVLCWLGILPYNSVALVFSTLFLIAVCWVTNEISAIIFQAPVNVESVYITALILALIITPISTPFDANFFSLAIWASIWSMASKYALAIGAKHIFNPVAVAVMMTALVINQAASWWVGTLSMLPFVLVGGFLIVKKIRRFDLVLSFLGAALLSILVPIVFRGSDPLVSLSKTLASTPLFFFASVMLTEPLTTPPTKTLRIWYGALVGFLFAPWVHVGGLYSTPEIALVVGNVFSYLVSPKRKFLLTLKEQHQIADHTADLIFQPDRPLVYKPGQYMEWTLAHAHPDARGNRRYFTLASSPTEKDLRIGVKFYQGGSSYKYALASLGSNDVVVASQLAGEFVLPDDPSKKLVFIAGGIGVTPFRSMVKYLLDRNEKRDIVMLYSNKVKADIAYADVFEAAWQQLGIRTVYVLTEKKLAPRAWQGKTGFIDADMIAEEIPDFADRLFYLSGPHAMIVAYEQVLKNMGVPKSHIKTDYFPGFV
jgi:ferredoxin-NADP reductase